jgi:hypothetical protein
LVQAETAPSPTQATSADSQQDTPTPLPPTPQTGVQHIPVKAETATSPEQMVASQPTNPPTSPQFTSVHISHTPMTALLSMSTQTLKAAVAAGRGMQLNIMTESGIESVSVTPEQLEWALKVCTLADEATAAGNIGYDSKCLELWLKAYELAPQYAIAAMSIGVVYARKGDFKSSIAYLEEAQRLDPHSERIANNLDGIQAEAKRRGYKG